MKRKNINFIPVYLLGIIGVLILLLLAFSQTPYAKRLILQTVLEEVNQAINGEISIEKLAGNLFTKITLDKICVKTPTDTILTVQKLELKHNPLTLLYRQLKIQELNLNRPDFRLVRTKTSWNIFELIPPRQETPSKTTSKPVSFVFSLKNLTIQKGQVTIQQLSDSIQSVVLSDLNLKSSGEYYRNDLQALVQEMNWQGQIDQLNLRQFTFNGAYINDMVQVQNLEIQTDSSRISLNGSYDLRNEHRLLLNLAAQPLSKFDLQNLNLNFPFFQNAVLDLQLFGDINQYFLKGSITQDEEQLSVHSFLNLKSDQRFECNCITQRLNLQSLLGPSVPTTALNIHLKARGQGLTIDTLTSNITINIDTVSTINKYPIKLGWIEGRYQQKKAHLKWNLHFPSGSFDFNGRLSQIHLTPVYRGDLKLTGPLWQDLFLIGDSTDNLNLSATIDGRGFDFDSLRLKANIFAMNSRYRSFPVDTLHLRGAVNDGQIQLDTLILNSPLAKVMANGKMLADSTVQGEFQFDIANLSQVPVSEFGLTFNLAGKAVLDGILQGKIDSLRSAGQLNLYQFKFDQNAVASANVEYLLTYFNRLPHLFADARLDSIRLGTVKIDSLSLETAATPDSAELQLAVRLDSLSRFRSRASLIFDDTLTVKAEQLEFDVLNYHFVNAGSPIIVKNYQDEVFVQNFGLRETRQKLWLHGWLDFETALDLSFQVENFDLDILSQYLPRPLSGRLYANGEIRGSFQQPELQLNARSSSIQSGALTLDSLAVALKLKENRLTTNVQALTNNRQATLQLLSRLTFAADSLIYQPQLQDLPEVNIKIKDWPLVSFKDFLPPTVELTGQIQADLKLFDCLSDLTGSGDLTINSVFKETELGIDYRNLNLQIKVAGKKLSLEKLNAQTDAGGFNATGEMQLLPKLDWPFTLAFKAHKFDVIRSSTAAFRVHSELTISGSIEQPQIGGQVTVERGLVRLPPLISLQTDDKRFETEQFITLEDSADRESGGLSFIDRVIDNARGTLQLKIQRNTWLRNDQINLELGGELDLVKKSADFALFGPVRVIRGGVKFYGKKFSIEKGELKFQGLPSPDPEIYVIAGYRLPEVYIQVLVGGTASEPKLSFQSDPEMEQKDIVAYLLFGKPFAFLSGNQKENFSDDNKLLQNAMGLAVGLLTNDLTRALADELQLDIVEFAQGSSWQSSTLRVGKYVGSGIFVFYSSDLVGEKETFSLEYHINDDFLLKADQTTDGTGGVDLWWEQEW